MNTLQTLPKHPPPQYLCHFQFCLCDWQSMDCSIQYYQNSYKMLYITDFLYDVHMHQYCILFSLPCTDILEHQLIRGSRLPLSNLGTKMSSQISHPSWVTSVDSFVGAYRSAASYNITCKWAWSTCSNSLHKAEGIDSTFGFRFCFWWRGWSKQMPWICLVADYTEQNKGVGCSHQISGRTVYLPKSENLVAKSENCRLLESSLHFSCLCLKDMTLYRNWWMRVRPATVNILALV